MAFKRGQSGNSAGRPAGIKSVRIVAKANSQLAVTTLTEIVADSQAPASARVESAQTILALAGMLVTQSQNQTAGGAVCHSQNQTA